MAVRDHEGSATRSTPGGAPPDRAVQWKFASLVVHKPPNCLLTIKILSKPDLELKSLALLPAIPKRDGQIRPKTPQIGGQTDVSKFNCSASPRSDYVAPWLARAHFPVSKSVLNAIWGPRGQKLCPVKGRSGAPRRPIRPPFNVITGCSASPKRTS